VSVPVDAPPADLIGESLRGAHRSLALAAGPVLRYPPAMSPFASLGPQPGPEAWAALAGLPGDVASLVAPAALMPAAGWRTTTELPVLQLVEDEVETGPDAEVVALTQADVPEMLELTRRARPGPFLRSTIAFGGYVGIRRDGVLAAMAGRRLQPPGWIEVSAVCTDPAHRGHGLGRRVTAAVVRAIHTERRRALLHVLPDNPARGLYESMGFVPAGAGVITIVQRAG
jgi:ribosomal protein S18 acetylase RimI-like enzyme